MVTQSSGVKKWEVVVISGEAVEPTHPIRMFSESRAKNKAKIQKIIDMSKHSLYNTGMIVTITNKDGKYKVMSPHVDHEDGERYWCQPEGGGSASIHPVHHVSAYDWNNTDILKIHSVGTVVELNDHISLDGSYWSNGKVGQKYTVVSYDGTDKTYRVCNPDSDPKHPNTRFMWLHSGQVDPVDVDSVSVPSPVAVSNELVLDPKTRRVYAVDTVVMCNDTEYYVKYAYDQDDDMYYAINDIDGSYVCDPLEEEVTPIAGKTEYSLIYDIGAVVEVIKTDAKYGNWDRGNKGEFVRIQRWDGSDQSYACQNPKTDDMEDESEYAWYHESQFKSPPNHNNPTHTKSFVPEVVVVSNAPASEWWEDMIVD